ncbi:origin recognition complex subunit 3, partial [Paragonimus westermani]
FTSSTRSTYLTLSEWYYNEIRIADQQLLPDETMTKNPVTRCRRSISQPSDRNQPVGRQLRNSIFPRSNQASPKRTTRRFTVWPEADRFTEESVSTSVSISSKGASPSATKLPTCPKPGPLVVILPQVESVASSVLEEFIELTSLYVSGQIGGRALPIILVFGLSTTPEVGFEARLSAPTLGRLNLQRFTVPPPAVFLEAVLNTFCMLEHYLNCAHPHLLLTPEKARVYLSSLPSQSLANMVSLTYPSVAALAVESCQPWQPSTPKPLRGKSPSLVDRLTEQLVVHWRVQYLVPPILKWFLHLTSHISPLPLGKSFTDLYRLWLKDGLVNSEAFSLTVSLLSGLSKEKLLQALDEAASYLDSPSCSAFNHLWPKDVLSVCHEMLADLAATTRQWRDALHTAATGLLGCNCPFNKTPTNIRKYPACQGGSDPLPTSLSPIIQAVTANPFDGRRKMSMRGLRQHLQELAAASPGRGTSPCSRVSSAWDLKRSAFLDWLRSELGRLIPFSSSLPLHEVFYGPVGPHSINKQGLCDSNAIQPFSVSLRRKFNPPYQKCMHLTLVDPGTYLQLPDLHLDSSDCLVPTLPDLCILYKLHLESTKMINLYDWLMAFATVIGENVCKDNPPSKQVQVRFFHGLAQLHHLGFIKSTRRKVDHVLRLTWGLTL